LLLLWDPEAKIFIMIMTTITMIMMTMMFDLIMIILMS